MNKSKKKGTIIRAGSFDSYKRHPEARRLLIGKSLDVSLVFHQLVKGEQAGGILAGKRWFNKYLKLIKPDKSNFGKPDKLF